MGGVGWEQKALKPVQLLRAGEGGKGTEKLTRLNSQMVKKARHGIAAARQSSLRRSIRMMAVIFSELRFLMGQKHPLVFKGAVLGFGIEGVEGVFLRPAMCASIR